jgi:hypothetical protein|tara:strand:+ start:704 stop:1189 length:486 start_codon:yes stop_codon:yes gene_type:complete
MKYIVIILWLGFVLAIGKGERSTKERTIISVDSTSHIDDYTYSKWDTFVDAVIYVESRGNDSAVGDNGKAVGCLQMHPIMVREVNRILAKYDIPTTYTLEDRYSREKSIEMFNIISEEYYCCEDYTFTDYVEIVARRWNGGPRGDKKRSTIKYWNNVQKRI